MQQNCYEQSSQVYASQNSVTLKQSLAFYLCDTVM